MQTSDAIGQSLTDPLKPLAVEAVEMAGIRDQRRSVAAREQRVLEPCGPQVGEAIRRSEIPVLGSVTARQAARSVAVPQSVVSPIARPAASTAAVQAG